MKFKKGKKLNTGIQSIRKDDEFTNGTAAGLFQNLKQLTNMNGEPLKGNFDQDLYTFELIQPDTGEVITYWADGGMRGAFKLAKVKEGMPIFIEHTGQKKIDEGTVQTYDIYQLEETR